MLAFRHPATSTATTKAGWICYLEMQFTFDYVAESWALQSPSSAVGLCMCSYCWANHNQWWTRMNMVDCMHGMQICVCDQSVSTLLVFATTVVTFQLLLTHMANNSADHAKRFPHMTPWVCTSSHALQWQAAVTYLIFGGTECRTCLCLAQDKGLHLVQQLHVAVVVGKHMLLTLDGVHGICRSLLCQAFHLFLDLQFTVCTIANFTFAACRDKFLEFVVQIQDWLQSAVLCIS